MSRIRSCVRTVDAEGGRPHQAVTDLRRDENPLSSNRGDHANRRPSCSKTSSSPWLRFLRALRIERQRSGRSAGPPSQLARHQQHHLRCDPGRRRVAEVGYAACQHGDGDHPGDRGQQLRRRLEQRLGRRQLRRRPRRFSSPTSSRTAATCSTPCPCRPIRWSRASPPSRSWACTSRRTRAAPTSCSSLRRRRSRRDRRVELRCGPRAGPDEPRDLRLRHELRVRPHGRLDGSRTGNFSYTPTIDYGGNNGRSALLGSNGLYYAVGNANNGNASTFGPNGTTPDVTETTGLEVVTPINGPRPNVAIPANNSARGRSAHPVPVRHQEARQGRQGQQLPRHHRIRRCAVFHQGQRQQRHRHGLHGQLVADGRERGCRPRSASCPAFRPTRPRRPAATSRPSPCSSPTPRRCTLRTRARATRSTSRPMPASRSGAWSAASGSSTTC